MTGFTSLEITVLKAIGDSHPADLRALLNTSSLTKRDNTGHGFYTSFSVDRRLPPLPVSPRLVDGPTVHLIGMGDSQMMGFILWLDDGYPDCLEGYQLGDTAGETIDLKAIDLHSLSIMQLEPPPQSA